MRDDARDDVEVVLAWLAPCEDCRAAAHALLRELLGARLGEAPASLRFQRGKHGKPTVPGARLQFSLSRSAGLAGYAFARGRGVGIDVEAVRPLADADAIAARIFPRREYQAYAALPACDRNAGFFRGWTRTEALAKAIGVGMGLSREVLDEALEAGWVVRSLAPVRGFAAALAHA